jgi:hypothetical protein
MTEITKTQLAKELGVSKARISQYVQRGMPVLSNGRLDRDVALRWIADSHGYKHEFEDRGVNRARELNATELNTNAEQFSGADTVKSSEVHPPAFSLFPDQVHRGAYWAAAEMVKQIGALAAATAIECGAPCQTAYAIEQVMPVRFMEALSELFVRNEIGPFADGSDDHAVWPSDKRTLSVNWNRMAASVGERVNIEAWERARRELPCCKGAEGEQ